MSQLEEQISKSRGLLSAVEAVTNRRAFITLFSTFTSAALLFVLFSAVAVSLMSNGQYNLSKMAGFIGILVVSFVVLLGISATGFLLNDTIRGRNQQTISSSLIVAVATLPRVIGVLLLLVVIGVLLMVLIGLVLLICKIPGIGPLLYTVAFPICAILVGSAFYATIFIVALHGPAIWEGNTVMRTVAILGSIARERLLSVVIQSILLGLLVTLVTTIVFGALTVGVTTTGGLSIQILGQGMGMNMLSGLVGGVMGGGDGAGYTKAAAFGMAILFGCTIVIPVLVTISGNCIIFHNVTENLSTAEVEESLQGAINAAREKAEQAKRQLEESRNQIAAANAAQSIPTASNACPKCKMSVSAGDVFCGNCGNRIG